MIRAAEMFEGWISMIESMRLVNAPCFDQTGVNLGPLSQFNFIFGGNGSGKTTVSRALADSSRFGGTSISWSGAGQTQSIRVYNRDYVQTTFGDVNADLPGVFLLGTASREVHDEIAAIESELAQIRHQRETFATTLGDTAQGTGKLGLIAQLRADLTDAAWAKRSAVPEILRVMFDGYRASKAVFLGQLLRVAADQPTSVEDLHTLEEEAESVLDETSTNIEILAALTVRDPTLMQGYSLLGESILGSSSVALAPLIDELRNSDWVQQGRRFLGAASGKCPFCQQTTPHGLAEQLAEYFDARYAGQLAAIGEFAGHYENLIRTAQADLDAVESRSLVQLDVEAFQLARAQLQLLFEQNQRTIQSKLDQPSSIVELQGMTSELAAFETTIGDANAKIHQHNQLVANRAQARAALVTRCWVAFTRGTVATELAAYEARLPGEEAARDSLQEKIEDLDHRAGNNVGGFENYKARSHRACQLLRT
jgi:wobble nucleotide-excising tRNase